MSLDFVAVGGTGQHVALAVADILVLAHSVSPTPWAPIRFLVIDADPSSADPTRPSAWDLARQQLGVLEAFPPGGGSWPSILHRKPFPNLPEGAATAASCVDDMYGDGAADLLLAPRQRSIPVGSGYHGEPWVAAALTERLINDLTASRLPTGDPLIQIRDGLKDVGGRVCVAGSAIGGTGAGVLPRFVQHLAGHQARKGKLCAVIALPWFQLESKGGDTLDMKANGTSCLWHYQQSRRRADFRLVLWGHPSPESAEQESHDGPAKQSAKRQLTLPYHAAASALAFLLSAQDSPAVANDTVAPVPGEDGTVLPSALGLGPLTIGQLLALNEAWMERMCTLLHYLEQGKPSLVAAWFQSALRVEPLDNLSTETWKELASKVEGLMSAKRAALDRLRLCKIATPVPEPGLPRSGGLDLLRKYFHGFEKVGMLPTLGSRLPPGAQMTGEMSNRRLLPERASDEAGFESAPAGVPGRVEAKQAQALIPFHEVDCTRVPDLRAPAMLLETFFASKGMWRESARGTTPTEGAQAVHKLMLRGASPAVPALVDAEGGDRFAAWVQRWFLTALGVVSGQAKTDSQDVAASTAGANDPHGLSWRPIVLASGAVDNGGATLGYASLDWLVVPTPTKFWHDASAVSALGVGVGSLDRIRGWLRALRQVGEAKFGVGKTPRWIEFLDDALGQKPDVDAGAYDPNRRIRILWADQEVAVPTLCDGAKPDEGLARFLCRKNADVFDLDLDPLRDSTDLPDAARRAWSEIQSRTTSGVPIFDPPGVGVGHHKPLARDVTWVDKLLPEAVGYLNGDLFLVPGAGRAYSLPKAAVPLVFDDIRLKRLTTLPAPIVGNAQSGSRTEDTPLWPVLGKYIGLVSKVTFDPPLGDQSICVRFFLRGGDAERVETRTYRPSEIDRVAPEKLELLAWPRVPTRTDGALQVLLWPENPKDMPMGARVLYRHEPQGSAGAWCDASKWLGSRERFHHLRAAAPGRPPGALDIDLAVGASPKMLEIRTETRECLEQLKGLGGAPAAGQGKAELRTLGLWALPNAGRPLANALDERWCVDLGSSSTVIAMVKGAGNAETIQPTATRDATMAASIGPGFYRADLAWMPTWDQNRPSDLDSPFMPSQVVDVSKRPVAPSVAMYGTDWVLDHGAALNKGYLERVRDNFKWKGDDSSRAYRSGYMQHLLEQAIEMESARRPNGESFPADLPVTFTLPIRQRSRLDSFAAEVGKVCTAVEQGTGVRILPSFQWESAAVAPNNVNVQGKVLIVVADLGGGTLDLWAQMHENGTIKHRAAESAYVGGRFCVDIIVEQRAGKELQAAQDASTKQEIDQRFRRELRTRMDSDKRAELFRLAGVKEYFQIVTRLVVAWTDAVRTRWSMAPDSEVKLVIAGLAWSLVASDEKDAQKLLALAAKDLEVALTFVPLTDPKPAVGSADERQRKTWLARACAQARRGRTVDELKRMTEEGQGIENVCGVAVRVGGKLVSSDTPLGDADAGANSPILIDEGAVRRLLPDPSVADLNFVVERLQANDDGGERSLGCRSLFDGTLVISPLACVAEVAIQGLRNKYAPTVGS